MYFWLAPLACPASQPAAATADDDDDDDATTTTTTTTPFGPVQSDKHNNSNQRHELLSHDVIYTETSNLAQQVTTKQIDHALGSRTFKIYLQFRKFSVLLTKAIRKCSPFYGTRRLITAFRKVCHWVFAMIPVNSVQPHTSHFFHTSFNFVFPSTLCQARHSSVIGIAIRLRCWTARGSNLGSQARDKTNVLYMNRRNEIINSNHPSVLDSLCHFYILLFLTFHKSMPLLSLSETALSTNFAVNKCALRSLIKIGCQYIFQKVKLKNVISESNQAVTQPNFLASNKTKGR